LEARKHQLEPFSDAVTEILSLRQAVLLGDPGSGKTTTLWKLAERLCAEAGKDPNAPIPVLVRFGFWTGAEQTLTEFIAKHSGPLGSSIDRLLEEKRVALLLDGMNEIPTGQWKAKHAEI
jgi:predicted NACHT family NTPase